jgi:hypothetical protein
MKTESTLLQGSFRGRRASLIRNGHALKKNFVRRDPWINLKSACSGDEFAQQKGEHGFSAAQVELVLVEPHTLV